MKVRQNVIKLMSDGFNKVGNHQKELRMSKYHIVYGKKMFLSQFNTSRRNIQAMEHNIGLDVISSFLVLKTWATTSQRWNLWAGVSWAGFSRVELVGVFFILNQAKEDSFSFIVKNAFI